MKRLFAICTLVVFTLLAGCEKGDISTNSANLELRFNRTDHIVPAIINGNYVVKWHLSDDRVGDITKLSITIDEEVSWIRVASASETSISFAVDWNTKNETRQAEFVVSYPGTESVRHTILQSYSVDTTSLSFSVTKTFPTECHLDISVPDNDIYCLLRYEMVKDIVAAGYNPDNGDDLLEWDLYARGFIYNTDWRNHRINKSHKRILKGLFGGEEYVIYMYGINTTSSSMTPVTDVISTRVSLPELPTTPFNAEIKSQWDEGQVFFSVIPTDNNQHYGVCSFASIVPSNAPLFECYHNGDYRTMNQYISAHYNNMWASICDSDINNDISVEEYFNLGTVSGPNDYTTTNLPPGGECLVAVFGLEIYDGRIVLSTAPLFHAIDVPSEYIVDITFDIETSYLGMYETNIHITPSRDDIYYAVGLMADSKAEGMTEEEILRTMSVAFGSGENNIWITSLLPDTEYTLYYYGVIGNFSSLTVDYEDYGPVTEIYKYKFKTVAAPKPKNSISNIKVYGPYPWYEIIKVDPSLSFVESGGYWFIVDATLENDNEFYPRYTIEKANAIDNEGYDYMFSVLYNTPICYNCAFSSKSFGLNHRYFTVYATGTDEDHIFCDIVESEPIPYDAPKPDAKEFVELYYKLNK